MNLKLAIPILLVLAGLFAWPFIEPHLERRRRSRSSRRRRDTYDHRT